MENIDFNSIPAKALNASTRDRLGKFLNIEHPLLSKDEIRRDYWGLAEQMGFQYEDIKYFQNYENPTKKVLESWTLYENASIEKLIVFLKKMKRHHIIQDLQADFAKDAKMYLERAKLLQEVPIPVPEVTSNVVPDFQYNDMDILTRHDAISGGKTKYDAYVCYANENYEFVKELYPKLEELGFKLYIRGRDLLAGLDEYQTSMQLIQERCKRVLIILTPDFLNCNACKVLATFSASLGFEEKRRKLVPILLEPCEVPWIFKFISKIDFTKPGDKGWMWNKLISSLHDIPTSNFIAPERKLPQNNFLLPKFKSANDSESNNPIITFPPSTLSLSNGTSSNFRFLGETSTSDSALQSKQSLLPKQKNKISFRFWQKTKPSKKNESSPTSSFSLASVSSSSNATSGFYSESGNISERLDVVNEA